MKKSLAFVFSCLMATGLFLNYKAGASTYEVVPKAPAISASLKPYVTLYRQGTYIGVMQDLQVLVEKEPNNTYAKYYLALCYTQLGYREEAQKLYQEIVDKKENQALTYYSKRALDCIGNPDAEQCKAPTKQETPNPEAQQEADEITKFIQSGRQFHPSVTDRVTKERLERQLQKEEYEKRQQGLRSSDSTAPTNEEIAAALNTLSKLGINPFVQMQNPALTSFLNPMNNYNYQAGYQNSDMTKMFLYNQMASGQNNFMNFGI